ncbi:MAG TPA: terminase small subunit [Rhizomicrobium sp.]|nr:terminase small subunit [Rhizomicrobium sp.]
MTRTLAHSLNVQQQAFAEAYVHDPQAGGNGTASAIAAGYAADCAKQTAYRLLRHDGVRAEIDRLTREALGDHASAAVALLGRVVRDEQAPLKIRVDAAKAVLDRAGFVAPKAPEPKMIGEKPIEEMSTAELQAFIRETREYIEREGQLIDVTPASVELAPTVA